MEQDSLTTANRFHYDYTARAADTAWDIMYDQLQRCRNKEETPHNVFPKKKNKLKDWSISARSLKIVIEKCLNDSSIRCYKFVSTYDSRLNITKIWNTKSNNIICTVKHIGNDFYIRYRYNSYYRNVIEDIKREGIKIHIVKSNNLGSHRGATVSNSITEEVFRKELYRKSNG